MRSTILIHCIYKAGGWQPKAAGGWFALLTFKSMLKSIIYSNRIPLENKKSSIRKSITLTLIT